MTGQGGPPVLFLDLDGTVRLGKDQTGKWSDGPEDVALFPEALPLMRAWRDRGGVVLGVTNQAGPVLGHLTYAAELAIREETYRQADGQLDLVLTCLDAPDAGCWCRKPMPGLIYAGLAYVEATRGRVPDRLSCLMVGDMDTDRQASEHAGVPFLWADQWRAGAQTEGAAGGEG